MYTTVFEFRRNKIFMSRNIGTPLIPTRMNVSPYEVDQEKACWLHSFGAQYSRLSHDTDKVLSEAISFEHPTEDLVEYLSDEFFERDILLIVTEDEVTGTSFANFVLFCNKAKQHFQNKNIFLSTNNVEKLEQVEFDFSHVMCLMISTFNLNTVQLGNYTGQIAIEVNDMNDVLHNLYSNDIFGLSFLSKQKVNTPDTTDFFTKHGDRIVFVGMKNFSHGEQTPNVQVLDVESFDVIPDKCLIVLGNHDEEKMLKLGFEKEKDQLFKRIQNL